MPKLTVNEASGTLFNYVANVSFSDLIAAGNGGQITIATLPAGSGVISCVVLEKVAFAGSTSVVVDVGTTGADPDEFIDALDVDAMTGPVANTGDAFVQAAGTTTIKGGALPVKLVSSATPVLLEINDSAVASLTAGELVVALQVLDFSKF
jgi:hypothetical protein